MFQDIDSVVFDIKDVPGNQRLLDVSVQKGTINIDGEQDQLIFEIESRYTYSEPDKDVLYGENVIARTHKLGDINIVTLKIDYSSNYNLTYDGNDEEKFLTKASTPYKLSMANKGKTGVKTNIDTDVM